MLTIAQVERETGLSKDVLRVWERRYGFPTPRRSEGGDRLYEPDQVERLRLIKRLMDQGLRPGRLFSLAADQLNDLAQVQHAGAAESASLMPFQPIVDQVLSDDNLGLRRSLSQLLAKQGLQRFVQDAVPQLNELVGNNWATGRLGIHQEHLYSEELGRLLRAAIGNLPTGGQPPRILLTTVSGEEHGLGLLMVEGVLAPEGAQCVSLGLQTPTEDIFRAVSAYNIQVLILSFSIAFPLKQGLAAIKLLRDRLPADVEIWVGGAMTRMLGKHRLPGVLWTPELADCLTRLADWRERHRN
ncbi:MAG: MerR family transcriptional regulator [Thiobacillaceae bacterium]|jgi:DNA-binding transcriptional MerR regulator/methylmalonyl-CoA mutase cobalamin-binding subunit